MKELNENVEVSIVIPTYNSEKYLKRCMDSVVSQSEGIDMEIIVIDGESTDKTADIVGEYMRDDPNIRFLKAEKRRAGSGRNMGFLSAKGTYIQYVDSDDFLMPGSIRYMLDKIKESKTDVLIAGFHDMKANEDVTFDKEKRYNIINGKDFAQYYSQKLIRVPWNKMYSGKFLKKNGILFNDDFIKGEDIMYNLDVFLNGPSVFVTDFVAYSYDNTNSNSLSKAFYLEVISQEIDIYEKVLFLYNAFNWKEGLDFISITETRSIKGFFEDLFREDMDPEKTKQIIGMWCEQINTTSLNLYINKMSLKDIWWFMMIRMRAVGSLYRHYSKKKIQ